MWWLLLLLPVLYTVGWTLYRALLTTYVAASDETSVLTVLSKLLAAGFNVTSDPLGEFVSDKIGAEACLKVYLEHVEKLGRLQRAFPARSISIAVKPSRFCAETDEPFFEDCLARIVRTAVEQCVFVWVDAEKRGKLRAGYDTAWRLGKQGLANVGYAVPSMHAGTRNDIRGLLMRGSPIRVVKGAYADGDLAPHLVDANFLLIAEQAVHTMRSPMIGETLLAVGTHDKRLLEAVRSLIGPTRLTIEYQFLYGVRTSLQAECLARGDRTLIYVPWGSRKDAEGFFRRRLKEGIRPKTAFLFLRNLLEARRFMKRYL